MNGFLKVFLICFAINAIWIIIKWLAKANKDSDKNSLSDEDDMIADKTINAKSDNDEIEKADSSTVSNISFNAKTPISIGAGQQFRLFYTLYNAVGKDFKLPEMAKISM
jgi:hypothetical protein